MPELPCVIGSDRPWNRGLAARLAKRCRAPFVHIDRPADLTAARLAEIDPRFVFFPHWSHRIPQEVFGRFRCVIFHMTDLPYGRGGSPLQNLIARGHTETVISALHCVAALDAGPVYLKRPLCLHGTAEEIFLRADRVIEDMIATLVETDPPPYPQQGEPEVFRRRRPADGDLRQAPTLDGLYDTIRMLDAQGYPPAFLDIGAFRLDFTRASRRTDAVIADVRITQRRETSDE